MAKDPLDSYPGAGTATDGESLTLEDFYAYMPQHDYIFVPCRTPWPAPSVDARVPWIPKLENGIPVVDSQGKQKMIAPHTWLDQHRAVEQMTWAPGQPLLIRDQLIAEGGWIPRQGVNCFNLYRPPVLVPGAPDGAEQWLAHVYAVYPDEAWHIIHWLAHRVQRPHEKINHALVLGGPQGIGKDSILEPTKRAIGPWNWQDESPTTILDRPFNGYLKAVVFRVNEARDLGDYDRFRFYDHMKSIIAAPPDVLRINEKHLREYYIPNLCGVIITTNHKTDGIHLAEDDRRHFVAWSPRARADFTDAYWKDLWHYYDHEGGDADVTAFLAELDLTDFNPKAPPPQTAAFWSIVSAGKPPEDAEMADALDRIGDNRRRADKTETVVKVRGSPERSGPDTYRPIAVTLAEIINSTKDRYGNPSDFGQWLSERSNRRKIPHRFETCGYISVKNPSAEDGLWVINRVRQAIYALSNMDPADQLKAAENHVSDKQRGSSDQW